MFGFGTEPVFRTERYGSGNGLFQSNVLREGRAINGVRSESITLPLRQPISGDTGQAVIGVTYYR